MASDAIPASLKAVTPYVRRAQEVERTGDDRAFVVAYFCRTFAMELGLKSGAAKGGGEAQQFLLGIMKQLEAAKKAHPDLKDLEGCEALVREYALEQMSAAENEYMSQQASKTTARRFCKLRKANERRRDGAGALTRRGASEHGALFCPA